MACAYLLTLPNPQQITGESPSTAGVTHEEHKKQTATTAQLGNGHSTETDPAQKKISEETVDETTDRLNRVFALHTSRRMKAPPSVVEKDVKHGVSIPSQRRWLHYWSRLLEKQGPPGFWAESELAARRPAPKVRLTQIQLRRHTLSGLKTGLVKTANAVMNNTGFGAAGAAQAAGRVWASLARYDDELVGTLEKWECATRAENDDVGRSREESERLTSADEKTEKQGAFASTFRDGRWDNGKMVRGFARFGAVGSEGVLKETVQVRCCARRICLDWMDQLIIFANRMGRPSSLSCYGH